MSLNNYSEVRYGNMDTLDQLQEALRDTLYVSPHFYYFVLNRSWSMKKSGMVSLREKLLTLRTVLLQKRMTIRGIKPSTRSDYVEINETASSCIQSINSDIQDLNNHIQTFRYDVNHINDYTTTNTSPIVDISLMRSSLSSSLNLGKSPYRIAAGDLLQIGDQVIPFDEPLGIVKSKSPWVEAVDIMLSLSLSITYKNLSVSVFELPQVPLLSKEEIAQMISIQIEGLDITFEFDGDFFEFVPGDTVLSIRVNQCGFRDVFKLPKKVTISNSTLYTSSKELRSLIGGTISSNVIHRGEVILEDGHLVSPVIDSSRAIIIIGDTFILCSEGNNLDLIAGIKVNYVDDYYKGYAKIVEETLDIRGISIPSFAANGGFGDSSADLSSVDFTFTSDADITEGDIIDDAIVTSVSGLTLTTSKPITEGGKSAILADYSLCLDILDTAPISIVSIIPFAEDLKTITEIEISISTILEDIDTLISVSSMSKGTYRYQEFCRVLADIRNAHLDLGLDRAVDLLYLGSLKEYFSLKPHQANFAKHAAKSARDVSRRMQTL